MSSTFKPSDTNGCSDSNLKQKKHKTPLNIVISTVTAVLTKCVVEKKKNYIKLNIKIGLKECMIILALLNLLKKREGSRMVERQQITHIITINMYI